MLNLYLSWMESAVLIFIVSFLLLEFVLERVLDLLNIKNLGHQLPEELAGYYDPEKYATSQQYERDKQKFKFVSSSFSLTVSLLFLLLGGFAVLNDYSRGIADNQIIVALIFFGILFLLADIFGLPFSIYHTFVLEQKYNFNKTTAKTFITDKIKGYFLAALIGGILLALFVIYYQWTRNYFWIYAWISFTALLLFIHAFLTSLILPLFNKLTPLPEGELKAAISQYCSGVKFPLKDVFVMDSSKRSTKTNAFFSGIGSKKTIVFFDTLITKHSVKEMVAIIAHEVGHNKMKHTTRNMILSSLNTLVLLSILSFLIDNRDLSMAMGVSEPSIHIGLVAFGMILSPLNMVIGIITNLLSRKYEFEADKFAVKTSDGEALKAGLKRLSSVNLSNLTPHPAYVFYHHSHPTVLDRIRAIDEELKLNTAVNS